MHLPTFASGEIETDESYFSGMRKSKNIEVLPIKKLIDNVQKVLHIFKKWKQPIVNIRTGLRASNLQGELRDGK